MRFHESRIAAPIWDRVVELIRDAVGLGKEQVTPETPLFWDSAADSLDTVELAMRIEEEFDEEIDANIPSDELQGIRTIGDLVDVLVRRGL